MVIDPIGLAPLFIALTHGMTDDERAARRRYARSLSPSACSPLFGLVGEPLLTAIGIGLPAFRISGGMLLFLMAVDMLFERRTERRERTANEAPARPVGVSAGDAADRRPRGARPR